MCHLSSVDLFGLYIVFVVVVSACPCTQQKIGPTEQVFLLLFLFFSFKHFKIYFFIFIVIVVIPCAGVFVVRCVRWYERNNNNNKNVYNYKRYIYILYVKDNNEPRPNEFCSAFALCVCLCAFVPVCNEHK